MNVTREIDYAAYKKSKKFIIEPSRRGTSKATDPEQMRIFAERQKRVPDLWRKMGITSIATLVRRGDEWVEISHKTL